MIRLQRVPSIWAVGRNYRDHAAEMNAPVPTQPLIFLKSGGCILAPKDASQTKASKRKKHIAGKSALRLQPSMGSIHHELEIMLFLGKSLQVEYYALALDLTARDIQAEAKKRGEPWTLSKSFKSACPVGPLVPFESWKAFQAISFELEINGEIRQMSKTRDMIFDGPALIEYLRRHFPIRPYDAVLTGTPQGVGPLNRGDLAQARITAPVPVDWTIKIS